MNDASLGAIVSSTYIGCSLSDGLVRMNDLEIGLIETTPRGHSMFDDDLNLALQQAMAKKLTPASSKSCEAAPNSCFFNRLVNMLANGRFYCGSNSSESFPIRCLSLNREISFWLEFVDLESNLCWYPTSRIKREHFQVWQG